MCGIVGAVSHRDVAPMLVEQLRRLEYRGYDSAGIAVLDQDARLVRERLQGKVRDLAEALEQRPLAGHSGIGHTRWPHTASRPWPTPTPTSVGTGWPWCTTGSSKIMPCCARRNLPPVGHRFTSDTDTEVIVHSVFDQLETRDNLRDAVNQAAANLHGAYALGVIRAGDPERLVATRSGSPLVIGLGSGENFIASDVHALLPFTRRFIFLEEGDTAELTPDEVVITDGGGQRVERPVHESGLTAEATEKGPYRHYMLKEIHEQPQAIADLLEGRLHQGRVLEAAFGPAAGELFDRVKAVQITACGTSYHAGMVARNWFEGLAGIPCRVEVASEFRYRHPVPAPDTLFVTISQSGETADTLAALRAARSQGFGPSLGIVNVPESSLARESDLVLMTRAGPEIGVASTKAFTSQLTALLLLVLVLGRRHRITPALETDIVGQLEKLPRWLEDVLALDEQILALSRRFADKEHALFLGRGVQYPVAKEGALKLKEISYIHAEAYPAGELKHGPLALVDARMPVIAVAPNDALLEKLKSNLEEVRAPGRRAIRLYRRGLWRATKRQCSCHRGTDHGR